MKPLIWKEVRENLKWVGLPALVLLPPMLLLGGPPEPMFAGATAFLLFLITSVFGAALGFLQVFFEARGDHRALLLHRPLGRSRIFLGKVLAGAGIYLLAEGSLFVGVQVWMAIPGHMAAPYDWRAGLPWLADVLAGLVYYLAGMLTAQREARWYGSRGLGLPAAAACTFLVWTLPEFWQAALAILVLGTLVGVAAWGTFLAGGSYTPQPPLARAALAGTFLTGLVVVAFLAKLTVGQLFDPGLTYGYMLDRQGRVLLVPWKPGLGPTEPVTDLDGQVPAPLQGRNIDRNLIAELEAPLVNLEWPIHRSYRNHGRLYVEYRNETAPGREEWYFASHQGRLVGYDSQFKQFLGSFGPDGFAPAGQAPGERFQGPIRYPTRLWDALRPDFLVFPGGVYDVDFSRRIIRKRFTPADGETVLAARVWEDRRERLSRTVVITNRGIHILTEAGVLVVSLPSVYDHGHYGSLRVGRLEGPERYVVWYNPSWWLEPEESRSMPGYVLEYDPVGKELTRRTVPPRPSAARSPAQANLGAVTSLVEVGALVETVRGLRSRVRATEGSETFVLNSFLEESVNFIPEPVYTADVGNEVCLHYMGLALLSAVISSLVCFLLARRYSWSRVRSFAWALCGLLFGPTGLLLMLALQEWPARIACPSCRRLRRVDRERCEHCGAPHALPARDGTEIFESPEMTPEAALVAR